MNNNNKSKSNVFPFPLQFNIRFGMYARVCVCVPWLSRNVEAYSFEYKNLDHTHNVYRTLERYKCMCLSIVSLEHICAW